MLSALILASCSVPTDDREFEAFEKVENRTDAGLDFDEDLDPGWVIVACRDAGRVDTRVEDGLLVIDASAAVGDCRVRVGSREVRSITVRGDGEVVGRGTFRALEEVDVRGSGSVVLEEVLVDDLLLTARGTGELSIGWLEADTLAIDIAGTGDVHLAGRAGYLDLRVTGSGSLDAEALTVEDLDAELTGSGNATVTVTGEVDAEVSGNGVLTTG